MLLLPFVLLVVVRSSVDSEFFVIQDRSEIVLVGITRFGIRRYREIHAWLKSRVQEVHIFMTLRLLNMLGLLLLLLFLLML